MTIQTVKNSIKHVANVYGFNAYDDPYAVFMRIAEPDTNYLEISIYPDTDWSKPEQTTILHFSVKVTSPDKRLSPEEMLKYADIIHRGAEMVMELEELHLSYTMSYTEEDND